MVEKNFIIRWYTFTPRGVAEIKLYALGGSTIQLANDEVSMNVLTWLTIISPTLLPFITESKTGTISFNPSAS